MAIIWKIFPWSFLLCLVGIQHSAGRNVAHDDPVRKHLVWLSKYSSPTALCVGFLVTSNTVLTINKCIKNVSASQLRIHVPTCGFSMGVNRITRWSRRRVALLSVVSQFPSHCAIPVDPSKAEVPDRSQISDLGWSISRTPVGNRSLQMTNLRLYTEKTEECLETFDIVRYKTPHLYCARWGRRLYEGLCAGDDGSPVFDKNNKCIGIMASSPNPCPKSTFTLIVSMKYIYEFVFPNGPPPRTSTKTTPQAPTVPSTTPARGRPFQCGVNKVPNRIPLVVGGDTAAPHSWPWHVVIYRNMSNRFGAYCGGSIISPRHILTAAHCVYAGNNRFYGPGHIAVGAKIHRIYVSEMYGISGVFAHPSFNIKSLNNDIAVIKLARDIALDDKAVPVCLPDKKWTAGQSCYVTGFGMTTVSGIGAAFLQQANINIISRPICKTFWGNIIDTGIICAGYHASDRGKGTHKGDSGGPLQCKENGRFVQYGVTSFGSPRLIAPSGYTDVSEPKYLDFIKNTMLK